MPHDSGPHDHEDPDDRLGALRLGDAARVVTRSVVGRRFFLADPRSQSAPGRARLAEIADELTDPAAAARCYRRMNLGPLAELAAAHGRLAPVLAGVPPVGGATGRRIRTELETNGLGWLGDAEARLTHALRAWDALYAAHYGVTEAVAQVEALSQALRVCRLAELAYSDGEPDWRDLADAMAARPMVPAEIYRSRQGHRLRPPEQVVQAVAVPLAGVELDRSALDAIAATVCPATVCPEDR